MPSNTTWTIERLLRWTTDFLRERGAASPRLDAEVLLAHARDCQRIELYTAYREPASDELRATFRDLVRRRAEGTPVAYLVGYREFYSLPFFVSPDVLIPRPETEHLVVTVLDLAKAMRPDITIADVGTGSGIIAVCCATFLTEARIWATDSSSAALAIAARNLARHTCEDRVTLLAGDLLEPLPPDQQLDIIASNPPYVSRAEYEELAVDVKNHEPREALLAGPKGTEVIDRLIPQASARLNPDGWLVLEHSPMIADQVAAALAHNASFHDVETIPDLAGQPRVTQARKQ